eukprot:TRINITY_DN10178_c0_g1_i1.p1 TRINITY_DN10178_c0_g1~~TRINITY_DN10178_c0_g1_i1.p1  ORF type:complete len:1210 (+),score=264.17 TRINITY_DN10178_c0_g1_i1:41-3631(+)
MYLHNFTLHKSSVINKVVYGNFSSAKAQEILAAKGKILELLRPDDNGKLQTVHSVEVFGIIRSLLAFRLTGSTRDYILVGSDSGRLDVLEFNAEQNRFDKIHEETFGRTGCRRIVPGQFLAADPKGRAVMISAVEKQKFVYILNRDSAAKLTISSPLEAHKSHGIVFDTAGVDVGFENPVFACLEFDYEDCDTDPTGEAIQTTPKEITFYELDLGLNHVSRYASYPVPKSANSLITVPGGTDGPGGVLILCEDTVIWRGMNEEDEIVAQIPRRADIPKDRGILVTSHVVVKQRDWFFFLIQTEYGDLFKVALDYDKDEVKAVKVMYFDTVPIALSLAFLKTGFLFVAAESGNHAFYQFQAIGEDEDTESFKVENDDRLFITPRPLKNLILIDEIQAVHPAVDTLVENLLGEETPQIYTACGRGPRSSLRILRHGIAVSERAVSSLPGVPNGVWSVKTSANEEHDRYIVVSFKDATMVLSIGETVLEVRDSGFLATSPTIHTALFGEDSLIQVYPTGIRYIRADKRVQEWRPPEAKTITLAAVNRRQVVIALVGGEIIYFELDMANQLTEVETAQMGTEVVALGIAPVPNGLQRARFLAVADVSNKMRIFSLNPTDCLTALSMQLLPHRVSALQIIEMPSLSGTSLYVSMGTENGVLYTATLDRGTGQLATHHDTRIRFLGRNPVKLFPVKVNGAEALLALSSRSWLCYNNQGRYTMMPLSYVPLGFASSFTSEQCPEGIVAISGENLRIFSTEHLGTMFNQTSIPLRYTPRKMFLHPQTRYMIIVESDDDTYPYEEKQKLTAAAKVKKEEENMQTEDGEGAEANAMPEDIYGAPHPGYGTWASSIRIMDLAKTQTLDILEMTNNETITSVTTCMFANRGGEIFLVVGTAQDLAFEPKRGAKTGFLHVYALLENGTKFHLIHKTEIGGIPGALCAYDGKLLVGVGAMLRLYDFGKKKLLRKCEFRSFPNFVFSLWTQQDMIVVGDLQQSYTFVKYNRPDNRFIMVCDDVIPRWLSAGTLLDNTTIAAGDKFGNIFVLRMPDHVAQQMEEDPTAASLPYQHRHIIGAPYKLELICNFYVGESITKVIKTSLTPGGTEVILYTTISGTVGVLVPFTSREDVDLFSHLEMALRQQKLSVVGRDHMSFRSYYAPVKGVIDGDLCEQYATLSDELKAKIADDLQRTPPEVQRKLEIMRDNTS